MDGICLTKKASEGVGLEILCAGVMKQGDPHAHGIIDSSLDPRDHQLLPRRKMGHPCWSHKIGNLLTSVSELGSGFLTTSGIGMKSQPILYLTYSLWKQCQQGCVQTPKPQKYEVRNACHSEAP